MKLVKYVETATGHRLIGCGKCDYYHGHNYRWRITIWGELEKNMVVNFSEIKNTIMDNFDHVMVLNKKDELAECLKEAIYLVEGNPTAEKMAKEAIKLISEKCDVDRIKVELWETSKSKVEEEKRW